MTLSITQRATSFLQKVFSSSAQDASLKRGIRQLTGFQPVNMNYYRCALTHRSVESSHSKNYERLEFLGDSVYSTIVSDYLFQKHPNAGEGYLSKTRARMINRKVLNQLAREIELCRLINYKKSSILIESTDIPGDALEAMIGALYLDYGYYEVKSFVEKQLINRLQPLEEDHGSLENFKSLLIEAVQAKGQRVEFKLLETTKRNKRAWFVMAAVVDGKIIGQGSGRSKKIAGQHAAKDACNKLDIDL